MMEKWEKEENLQKLKMWAEKGLTMEEIADHVGVRKMTLYNWCEKSAIIDKTLTDARNQAISEVEGALFKAAINGNITAQIFYLKNRRPDRWKDRYDNENKNVNVDKIELVIE